MSHRINFEDICQYNLEHKQNHNKYLTFPKNIGEGKIDIIELDNGLSVHHFDIKASKDFILENKFERKLFSFTTFLKGKMKYQNVDFKFDKVFNTNTLIMSALNQENGLSYYKSGEHVKGINISVDELFFKNLDKEDNELLNTIIENLNKKPYFSVLNESSCNFKTLENLNSLLNYDLNENFRKLYLQSKLYEFLYESFNKLSKPKNTFIPFLEQQYLFKVKEYIEENLYKELTLKELSKIASSNETNLQKNFKLFFNTTVFKYILNQRMKKAKELLRTNDYSIQEIANLVGYKHQSNFTIAFFKTFNVRPKEYMKDIKYY